MEEQPKFIKEFSKENSPERRQQVAQEIMAKRSELLAEKKTLVDKQAELQQSISEHEQTLAEQLEAVKKLSEKIEGISTSTLGQMLNYFELKKTRADLAIGQKTYEDLKRQQNTETDEYQTISGKLESEETPTAMKEAEAMLNGFYKDQKRRWGQSEYTKEDITKYFSEENLASLSIEDYALLLKRFPKEMVAHVTRQGIRDHVGMVYHTAGGGAYSNGFMKMAEDGRLRSPLGVHLAEREKERSIAEFLHLDERQNKQEALKYLEDFLAEDESGGYADRMAVHFATEEVADCYYGSEKGNEIFVAYPSAYISSQYYFNGQLNKSGGGYWNDQWVWANEERGMDLNAGLVFIPAEARVDKKTGSRYDLDANKNPIKNSEYQVAFRKVLDLPDFHSFANQVMEISGKMTEKWDSPNLSLTDKRLLEKLEPFRNKLENDLGITDKRLQYAILHYQNLFNLNIWKKKLEEEDEGSADVINETINNALKEEGVFFLEAKDTISSKDFWEKYFADNPIKRPSKIIYYKGSDSTCALIQWKEEHGLSKETKDRSIGFPEQRVERDAPQATAGSERFKTLAEKVIEDYFSQEKSIPKS